MTAGSPGRRIGHLCRRGRQQPGNEEGYSLVEISASLALLLVLFAMTIPIVSTFFSTSGWVTDTYNNENQLLPVSTKFQDLIRSVVSPAPPGAQPVPAFGVYSASGQLMCAQTGPSCTGPLLAGTGAGLSDWSITFFTNIGDPNGPAMVVGQTTGNFPDQTFSVTLARAVTKTCPGTTPTLSGNLTSTCSFGQPLPLFSVSNLINTPSQPIVSFTTNPGSGPTPVPPPVTSFFANCTTAACPASQVLSVGVDLRVNVNPSSGNQADEQTVIYELSTTSQAFDPIVG